ncbi:amino acid adenylation domain-containing protein [Lentzea sp. NEAU-D13]|uniref:Phenyloxazoline synthase MbtB n=1 Tax=Lentzea alba TaxID=2714351 RepID=A0A7C9RVY1_9PSEU|nr:non-ribosomal peptide synthetase [Lentzea alba]NGY64229.1 amino acid adenylation domain-containing protein [Lentzea alba]
MPSAETLVRELVAELIGLPAHDVDLSRRFAELGVESLAALRLRRLVAARTGVELPLTSFLGDRPAQDVLAALENAVVPDRPAVAVVPSVSPGDVVGLTAVQAAYWAGRGDDFTLGGVATFWYHEYDLGPDVDLDAVEKAWNRLVAHHPMLRTTIGRDGRQREHPSVAHYRIGRTDLTAMTAAEAERALAALREERSHQVRPAHEWPLFDLHAVTLPGGGIRLCAGFDVLVLDFTSWRLLMSQWGALVADPQAALPVSSAGFLDIVAHRETDPVRRERRERDRQHWLARLADLPPAPALPTVEFTGAPRFRRRSQRLTAAEWSQIRATAAAHGVSPTAVLLAAFGLVLSRWGAGERFSVNTTLFDRPEDVPGAEHLVGDFTTTALVPLTGVDPLTWNGFASLAREVNAELWTAIDHRTFAGVEVLRELAARRGDGLGTSGHPVVFTSGVGIGDGGRPAEWLGTEAFGVSQTPQVLLDHLVWEEDGELRLMWDALDAAFPPGFLDGLTAAQALLLRSLAGEPELWTAPDLGWNPSFDRLQPLDVAPFGDCGPLLDAPLRQAAVPDAPALLCGAHVITHEGLARAADEVGRHLVASGVKAGELVLVAVPKGVAQVAAVLGVHRCGAGYVPVDPGWPAVRIEAVCERAAIRHAIVPAGSDIGLPDGLAVSEVDSSGRPVESLSADITRQAAPDDLAYVIFTSGSTGVPKGVAIEHRQARTTVDDITDRFAITAADRVLALSALSFDLSVYDIFGVLGAGGAMVLPDAARQRDPQHWCELIGAHRVTVWNTAPALLEMLVEYAEADPVCAGLLRSLRLVMLSGDWIPVTLPDRLRALVPGVDVRSLGGATEASIWSITYEIGAVDPEWPSVPYGRALRDQTFYVLDDDGRPCPVGTPGELFIGGAGVARGYIGDEPQTAARFAVHPVLGERLYRTGDLGRWRADGEIQFLGRTDRQVKVRGHRIELGDVESALDRLSEVRQAVAAVVPGPDERPRLIAHVALNTPLPDADRVLAAALGRKLPDYMIPSRFVWHESLPVTENGKVDHKALPNPFRAKASVPSAHPVEAIVREVLGSQADFSVGLVAAGATSLDVVRIANAVEDLNGVRPAFRDLVAHPTVDALVRSLSAPVSPPVEPVRVPEVRLPDAALKLADALTEAARWLRELHDWSRQTMPSPEQSDGFPLTEMQLSYLVGRADDWLGSPVAPHYYTEADVSDLDVARLENALRAVVARHPMLRAAVTEETLQRVTALTPSIEVLDLRELGPHQREQTLARVREERSHRVLDPHREPMLHLAVSRLTERTSRVHFGLDLLFCDARSAVILVRELVTAYEDPARLPAAPDVTFEEWAGKPQQADERSLSYWRQAAEQLADGPDLPLRVPVAGAVRFRRRRHVLDSATWTALRERARTHGLTPAGLLVSALGDVLRAGGAGDRFTLVMTAFDRPAGHEGVIGDYTSTLLLDMFAVGGSFLDRAQAQQTRLWADLEHSAGVHGNVVLRQLTARRGRQVLLPVVFSSGIGSTGSDASELLEGFGRTGYAISQTPHVVLDCQVFEHEGTLRINWDCVDDAFPAGYLDRLFAAYTSLVTGLVAAEAWHTPTPADGLRPRAHVARRRPVARPRQEADPATEAAIADVLGGLLGRPGSELERTRTFFELGATSLLLVQAHRVLRSTCAPELTVLDLFSHPTIRALAAHLGDRGRGDTEDSLVAAARDRGRRRTARVAGRRSGAAVS